ncbi:MAG TPA: hypothetical protein VIB39_19480 [Candidatus Angelobacter sp.]
MKKLGKLGAMSALAMSPLARVASATPACHPFSIVLHGLFLLDVFADYIQISTPQVCGHTYFAGPFSKKITDYTPVTGFHDQRWDSRIYDPPDPGDMPVLLPKVGDPIHKNAFLSFLVPFPDKIHSFRTFDESEVDYPKDYIRAKKFPLVLALEYTYLPNLPPIENTSLDRNKNYHVFAESPSDMDCPTAIKHGTEAIKKLWQMLPHQPGSIPLPKNPNKCAKDPDPDAGSPCLTKYEEYGLSELLLEERTPGLSVHLPLCANFIVQ